MRHLIAFICLSLFTLSLTAQDTVRRPANLPDPIFQNDLLYRVDAQQVAWLDNETVLVSPFTDEDFEYDADGNPVSLETSFRYSITDNQSTILATSPFRADMPSDLREWYRVGETEPVLQSPYSSQDTGLYYQILYRSNVMVTSASRAYPITMHGTYSPELTTPNLEDMQASLGQFEPTDLMLSVGTRVLWSRDSHFAFVEPVTVLDLETGNDTMLGVYYADGVNDRVLAMSDDGQRMIFASSMPQTPESTDNNQKLVIWDAPYYDESCGCTYDERLTFINPEPVSESTDNRFVGASFVNENTILYIGEMGLMRHNLLTGISTLVDPNYNSGWIVNAHFSPDNSHVLIVTDQEIYVLRLF